MSSAIEEAARPSPPGGPALPLGQIVSYGTAAVGVTAMAFINALYLFKYSTDVLLIAPGVMGLLYGASRIWDAISDPIAGHLSDRTQSRLGRRRPWMLAGALPVGLVFVMLFSAPRSLGPTALTAWMCVAVLLFYTAMTIFSMPHDSLGAELTSSYHDRNRVFGIRRAAFGLGSLPVFAALTWLAGLDDPRAVMPAVALVAGVVTAGLMLFTGARIRERLDYRGRGSESVVSALRDVVGNPHARSLLIVFFIQQVGIGSIMFMAAYYCEYLLGVPEALGWLMGGLFLASLLSIPVWIALGRRFEKKSLVLVAMVVVGAALASMGFLGKGDLEMLGVIAIVAGICVGGLDVLLPSIQADVIDSDELATGERKEGVYFAAWAFANKTASGIAGAIAGFLLASTGFAPNAEQSEETLFAMRMLMSGIPVVCYGVGVAAFARFGLSESKHREIRRALDERAR